MEHGLQSVLHGEIEEVPVRAWSGVALVAAMASGCAGTQYFDAAEKATGLSPEGLAAAEYDLWGQGGNLGEARVWSSGAYEGAVDGAQATVIEVVVEIENNGATPMMLGPIQLRSMRASGESFDHLRPVRVEGDAVIPARDEGRVRAYFALPERYDPEDIARFEVEWSVRQDQRVFSQRTEFLRTPDYYAYGPYSYPWWGYDPFLFPARVPIHEPAGARPEPAPRAL